MADETFVIPKRRYKDIQSEIVDMLKQMATPPDVNIIMVRTGVTINNETEMIMVYAYNKPVASFEVFMDNQRVKRVTVSNEMFGPPFQVFPRTAYNGIKEFLESYVGTRLVFK